MVCRPRHRMAFGYLGYYLNSNVFVSASKSISCEEIDEFVCGKASYVIKAANRFAELAQYKPQPKQYVSGETFTIELICFLVVR